MFLLVLGREEGNIIPIHSLYMIFLYSLLTESKLFVSGQRELRMPGSRSQATVSFPGVP